MLQTPHSHSQSTYEEENHTYSTFNYSGGCYPYLRWTMDMEAGMRWDFWKDGCGKTMLMRAVAGLIYPTSGSVIIDGEVLGTDRSFPKSMGLLILDATLIHNPLILNKNQYKGAFL